MVPEPPVGRMSTFPTLPRQVVPTYDRGAWHMTSPALPLLKYEPQSLLVGALQCAVCGVLLNREST